MASADLTAARLREVLHYDPATGVFTWLVTNSNRAVAGSIAGTVETGKWHYVQISIDGQRNRAHRLAFLYMRGSWPLHQMDHEDRNPSNNRWLNLRPATNKQNAENTTPRNNSSGHRGVRWHKPRCKWAARITHNGVERHLGLFENLDDAISARAEAEKRLYTHAPTC